MSNQMKNRISHKKTAGDDRNLVLVDDDFQDADFEDRVWLFWQRHGKRTIAGGIALFLAIIAVIVYVQTEKMRVAALQAEYAATETVEQKLAFAKANESDPIAGTAYFAVGSEFAESGKYAEAASAFGNAARVLSGKEEFNAMQNRAVIASAAALARTGTPEDLSLAKESLKKLASLSSADPIYRGQAMYELAVAAVTAGDLDEARLWINEMDRALDPTNFWQARKRTLIAIEPALALPAQD